jgi:hypothetical protein
MKRQVSVGMFRKNIKRLEEIKLSMLCALDDVNNYEHNPEIKAVSQSDLNFRILCIEDKIRYEKTLLPFKYTLAGFVVIAICALVYSIIVKA